MLIKNIKLQNIRSFLEEGISFPNGSILLSGDVGAGKSSVLLAIDFALFGLGRGSLSGASLLRNGKKKGYVELNFEVDGKNVIIKRTLKREANVVQDSGSIIINDVKKELTPIELKQAILQLLNYPGELLTKTKSLIYKYTVYTPQEEMKRILLENIDSRLDILRRVFGIDKYKRIKENSDILMSSLKDKAKELNNKIVDLEDKKNDLDKEKKNKNEIIKNVSRLDSEIDKNAKELDKKRNVLVELENSIERLRELRKQLELNENNLLFKVKEFNSLTLEISDVEKKINGLEIEAKEEIKVNKDEVKEKQDKIFLMENNVKSIDRKIQDLKTKREYSSGIIKKILEIDICPLCMQNVGEEHKKQVKDKEEKSIREFEEGIKRYSEEQLKLEKELKDLRLEIEILKQDIHKTEIIKLKINSLNELKNRKESVLGLSENAKKEIGMLNTRKIEISKEIEKNKDIEEDYIKEKQKIEEIREIIMGLEIEKVGFEKVLENLNAKIEMLEKDVNEKIKIRDKAEYIGKIILWLDEYFIKLIDAMEKNIMIKVHNDFNTLFQKWFSILVDNEVLKIRIDEEFTPIIEQAGHEIEYDFLSGGERTAAALAYRLALNQVINSLISTIKTKDLLVLDEPTEGFSSDQLDRIKLILDELNMKQIIIVSHESKIESFVDTILRFEKKDGISRII